MIESFTRLSLIDKGLFIFAAIIVSSIAYSVVETVIKEIKR